MLCWADQRNKFCAPFGLEEVSSKGSCPMMGYSLNGDDEKSAILPAQDCGGGWVRVDRLSHRTRPAARLGGAHCHQFEDQSLDPLVPPLHRRPGTAGVEVFGRSRMAVQHRPNALSISSRAS